MTYLLTLEIDVLDASRLIAYARDDASNIGLSPDEVAKLVTTEAEALRWLFDDNIKLNESGSAEIVHSSCEPVNQRWYGDAIYLPDIGAETMNIYLLTLEIDILDASRLIAYVRNDASNMGLSPDFVTELVPTEAEALRWLFDDNTKLNESGSAEIVHSSCEPVGAESAAHTPNHSEPRLVRTLRVTADRIETLFDSDRT